MILSMIASDATAPLRFFRVVVQWWSLLNHDSEAPLLSSSGAVYYTAPLL